MKVCQVTGEYPPMIGGIADQTEGLALGLQAAGDQVVVVCGSRFPARPATGSAGVPVVGGSGWSLLGLPALIRTIQRFRPDVVHIQYETAAFDLGGAITLLPGLLRVPVVVTFHDTNEPYLFPKAGRLRRRANAHLARSARVAICTNVADRRSVLAYGPKDVRIVPLGNNVRPIEDPVAGRTCREQLNVPAEGPLIGYFGLAGAGKGVEDLLEAVASAPQARLCLIGSGVGDADPTNAGAHEAIGAAIQRLGIAERVVSTGRIDLLEVSRFLSACDLIVLPYRDGASFRRTTLIAALAHGRPVVTTAPLEGALDAADGLPALCHGDQLWFVPRRDPAKLGDAVGRLLADANLRRRLGEAARDAGRAFEWPAVVERTRAIYQEVAGG